MKLKFLSVLALGAVMMSCGGEKKNENSSVKATKKKEVKEEVKKDEVKTETSLKIDLSAPMLDNKGIGPIKNLKLEAINDDLVAKGKEVYRVNCTACHKLKKRYIGPALGGVTKIRSPEWIMNMIMNPEEMIAKDPIGKALIAEYNAPMANQNISEEDARAILEFLRTKN